MKITNDEIMDELVKMRKENENLLGALLTFQIGQSLGTVLTSEQIIERANRIVTEARVR